jgi:hypothetical protein
MGRMSLYYGILDYICGGIFVYIPLTKAKNLLKGISFCLCKHSNIDSLLFNLINIDFLDIIHAIAIYII